MNLIETLKENYAPGEPIFSADVEFRDYSRSWISKELARLHTVKELCRFDKGVYYIPDGKPFDLDKLVREKYIWPRGKSYCIGYHTGDTFLHDIKLISAAPEYIEICTQNWSERSSEKDLYGKLRLLLRKPRDGIIINGDNIPTLQLLDLLSTQGATFFYGARLAALRDFICNYGIKPEDVLTYLKFYPSRTSKALLFSGLAELIFKT